MKYLRGLFLIGIIVVLLLVVACDGPLAGEASRSKEVVSATVVEKNLQNSCVDSDGDDQYLKGITKGIDEYGQVVEKTDFCSTKDNNNKVLMEFVCEKGKVVSKQKNCEWGCSDGACVKEKSNKNENVVVGETVEPIALNTQQQLQQFSYREITVHTFVVCCNKDLTCLSDTIFEGHVKKYKTPLAYCNYKNYNSAVYASYEKRRDYYTDKECDSNYIFSEQILVPLNVNNDITKEVNYGLTECKK